MFVWVMQVAKRVASASNVTYIDGVLRAYERAHRESGGQLDPMSLAVWGEFETERKRRTAALANG